MQVHFTARGNFRPLQTSLRGLNQQMTNSVSGFGRAAAVNVNNPINNMVKDIERGRMGFKNLGTAMKNQTRFLREHNALMDSRATVTKDAAGNARVLMEVDRKAAIGQETLGQRFKYTNTMMHAFGRNTIAVGKNMQWAGRQVMIGLTLPLGLLANAAVKAAEEYDRNMTRIIKVNSEASRAQGESEALFEMVTESIRRQTGELVDLGASMGFMAAETTDMVAQFAQMGYVGTALDQLTESAIRLSRVSGTELETSIELTRLTAQAFGTELEDLNETFARLNMVENNTALSLEEMATAMPVIAGVANTMGLEIEEVSGLLAMMKENGISAKEGATALRTGLIQIVQEATDPAIEAFANIGLNLEDMKERMQTLGDGDVMYFFDELGEHLQMLQNSGEGSQAYLNDFTAAIGKLTGTRQAARFLTFLGEIPDRTEEGTVAFRSFMGATADATEAMRIYEFEQRQVDESAAGTADRLRAELNVELTRIGENFLDVANKAREIAVAITRWFNELDESTKRVVLTTGALVAALGPVTMLAGIFANAFGQIITLITKFLPKMSLATLAQRAMKEAYYDSTRAIMAETAALNANITAKNGAAAAAGANTTAVQGATAARTGAVGGAKAPAKGFRGRAAGALGGMAMMGGTGKFGAVMAGAAKAAAAIAAGLAAAAAAVAAIAASFAAVAIFSNPREALAGFREAIEGPMNRLRAAWDGIMQQVRRVIEMFREAGGEGSGLASIAYYVGQVAGALGGVVVDALAIIINLLQPIIDAFEFVFRLIEGIVALISGDAAGAMNAFTEMWKALGRVIAGIFASVLDLLAAGLSALEGVIPGIGSLGSEAIAGWADDLRNIEAIQSNITTEVIKQNEVNRALQERFQAHTQALAESNEYMQRLTAAGVDVANLSNEQVKSHKLITEEMKVQILAARRLEEINRRLLELQGARANLEVQLENLKKKGAKSVESQRWTGAAMASAQREINRLLEESENVHANIGEELNFERQVAQALGEDTEEMAFNMDDFGQNTEEAAEAAEELAKALNDAKIERLEEKAADLRDRIQESERAAQQWASALQGAVGETMSAIADAVREELESQIEAQDEAFNRREERAKAGFEADLERINRTADRQLERLDEREAREEEAERRRQRYFEQEKARITYLKGMEQQNVSMDEAIARGDIGEAARIRIGLQKEAERFMLESYEREEQKFAEAKKSELDAQRKKIAAIREEQTVALQEAEAKIMRQLQVERNAAARGADARRRAVERYLADWQRVTPATEGEFRRHLGNLETNMRRFGIGMKDIAAHYTQASGNTITSGFTNAVNRARAVVREQNKWTKVGRDSGAAFRAGLARELRKVENDIDRLRKKSEVKIKASSGDVFSGDPGGGRVSFSGGSAPAPVRPVTRSRPIPTQARPPERPILNSRPIPSSGGRSVGGSFGTKIRSTWGSIGGYFHEGGDVNGGRAPKGLKRDERPAVLQTGEFVVQRDAVRSVGKETLEAINKMKYHDGGIVDFSRGSINEGGMLNAMAGFGAGKLATMATASILKSGGIDPFVKVPYNKKASGRQVGKAAGKDMGKATKAVAKKEIKKQEAAAKKKAMKNATSWRGSSSGWPKRKWATLSGNTRAAQNYFKKQGGFPGGIGSGVHRGVAKSDHSWGKALDFMVAPLGRFANKKQQERGWQVANWHIRNPGTFGTKYVIWDRKINSGDKRGWRPYNRYGTKPGATLGHYDHVHVSYLHKGGQVKPSMPSMRTGGKIKTDNTIANLHKGERVLTAPSTAALETAIQKFALGGGGGAGNTYNLEFNVNGGNIDEKALAKKVVFEIDKMERSKGRKRVVSG